MFGCSDPRHGGRQHRKPLYFLVVSRREVGSGLFKQHPDWVGMRVILGCRLHLKAAKRLITPQLDTDTYQLTLTVMEALCVVKPTSLESSYHAGAGGSAEGRARIGAAEAGSPLSIGPTQRSSRVSTTRASNTTVAFSRWVLKWNDGMPWRKCLSIFAPLKHQAYSTLTAARHTILYF